MCTKKEDPLFQFYLEDTESPAKDSYSEWLMIEPEMAIENDEVLDVDIKNNEIVYRRVCEYKGMTYAFNYLLMWDREGRYYFPDKNSVVRVYPKEVTKIIYTEEM